MITWPKYFTLFTTFSSCSAFNHEGKLLLDPPWFYQSWQHTFQSSIQCHTWSKLIISIHQMDNKTITHQSASLTLLTPGLIYLLPVYGSSEIQLMQRRVKWQWKTTNTIAWQGGVFIIILHVQYAPKAEPHCADDTVTSVLWDQKRVTHSTRTFSNLTHGCSACLWRASPPSLLTHITGLLMFFETYVWVCVYLREWPLSFLSTNIQLPLCTETFPSSQSFGTF